VEGEQPVFLFVVQLVGCVLEAGDCLFIHPGVVWAVDVSVVVTFQHEVGVVADEVDGFPWPRVVADDVAEADETVH